mmetsp:Transcript_40111/g.67248  ORF Transcript_40111/g.67248 Transcript_40111/m.67248 type:complete len:206 (-) Transcript_40111:465-1082(-)
MPCRLFLQEARVKHKILEGVGIALRRAVELVQEIEGGGFPIFGLAHHILPFVDGFGDHVHDALQRLALRCDALQEGGLTHANVALDAERQPRGGSVAALRLLQILRQERRDGPRVPGVPHSYFRLKKLHHNLCFFLLLHEHLFELVYRVKPALNQAALRLWANPGHIQEIGVYRIRMQTRRIPCFSISTGTTERYSASPPIPGVL